MAEFIDIVIDQDSDFGEVDFWFEDDHGELLRFTGAARPTITANESEIRIRLQHDTIEKL
jgi:hypothetical protein